MKTELTNELPENGKAAPSADALVEKAKNSKLTDDELDKVAGGIQLSTSISVDPRKSTAVTTYYMWCCPYCNTSGNYQFNSDNEDRWLQEHIQSDHPEKSGEYMSLSIEEKIRRYRRRWK